MPVAFNEPLSFLQRLTEYMEHVHLVRSACGRPQALERMQVGGGLLPGVLDMERACQTAVSNEPDTI